MVSPPLRDTLGEGMVGGERGDGGGQSEEERGAGAKKEKVGAVREMRRGRRKECRQTRTRSNTSLQTVAAAI